MSGSVRKRKFNRDSKEGTKLPAEICQKITWPGKTGHSYLNGNNGPNWSDSEVYDTLRSDDSFEGPSWQPFPERSGAEKDDDIDEDFNGASEAMRAWDVGNSYSIRTSPDFDGRGRRNHRWSPNHSWRRSHRGSSRSWSRSHSPVCDFKWESYGWSERSRHGSEEFPQPCKDFAVGRCRRGSQCRFLHQDNLKNRDGRYSDIDLVESRGSRREYRGASRYANTDGYRNYSRYMASRRYENFYDGERNEPLKTSSRSTNHCNDFRKGKFYKGSPRRYVHHRASGDGYDRSNRDAPFDHDRKHRGGYTLCKYFAMGKCRNGDYCRFSHDDPAHRNPDGRSLDDRWGHDLDDENNSWDSQEWNDTAAVSDIAKSSGWGNGDVGNMNFTDVMAAENSTHNRWGHSLDNENRSSGGPVRKDKAAEKNEHQSSRWGSGSSAANMGISESEVVKKLYVKEEPPFVLHGSQSQILNGISIPDHEQNITQETSGLQPSATVVHPTVSESSCVQQRFHKRRKNNAITATSNTRNDASFDGYDRSNGDASFDHDRKHALHRSGYTLCKYFAMGKCRKGDHCRFSHDGPEHKNPEGRSRDDRWGHDLDDKNNSWDSLKWNDTATVPDITKSSGWGDGNVGNMNVTDSMAAENTTHNRWGHSLDNKNRSSGGPVRKDKAAERDEHQSSRWGSGSSAENLGISESEVVKELYVKEEPPFVLHGSQSQTLIGISIPDREQNITQETSGLQLAATVVHPKLSESSCVQQRFRKRRKNNAITATSNSHNNAPFDDYDRSNGDTSFDHDRKHVLHQSGDTLCKYFVMGKCRKGDYCRFSHDGPEHKNPEGRSRDDRSGHDLDDKNISWDSLKWSDTAAVSDFAKSSGWGDGNVGNLDVTDSMAAENSTHNRWRHSLDNKNRSSGSAVRKDKSAERDEHQSSRWGSGSSAANMGISESEAVKELYVKEEPQFVLRGSQSQTLNGISIPDREQKMTKEISGLQLAATVVHPTVSESSNVQQHSSKKGNNNAITASSNSHSDVNLSGNIVHTVPVPGQCFKQDGDIIGSRPFASVDKTCVDEISQSQQTLSLNPSNGHTFDLNGPVEPIISSSNLQSQIQFCRGESVETQAMVESKVPQVTSGTPHNEVTREQVTQSTKLSLSLAQGFGSEQQLPHLYSALNPPNSTGSVPSLPNSASFSSPADSKAVQRNPATCSLERYDSVGDSMYSSKPVSSKQPPDFLSNLIEQQNQVPSGPNFSEFNKCDSSEKEHYESSKLKQQDPIGNSETKENIRTVPEEWKQEQEIGHSENVDLGGRVEEGNKNKDEKEMLIFKIALAEFVKELLKPIWKEGRMSKDVYKTIVKKVVDKVIVTINAVHIPKTKEKIDHYLSYSKPKISKLVQAYVEIYPKSQE